MNVAVLRDRMHFGELAMMGTARIKKSNQQTANEQIQKLASQMPPHKPNLLRVPA
jgi:hypothetical protein